MRRETISKTPRLTITICEANKQGAEIENKRGLALRTGDIKGKTDKGPAPFSSGWMLGPSEVRNSGVCRINASMLC